MAYTEKGSEWERKNSLWILWALVPVLYFMSFVHISNKVEHRPYKILAGVHTTVSVGLCIFLVLAATGLSVAGIYHMGSVILVIYFLHHILVFVQSITARPRYLKLLEQQENKKQVRHVFSERTGSNNVSADSRPSARVELNTCTEEDLAALPGIQVADAKKVIRYRESKGAFADVDEFFRLLELKPHMIAPLMDVVYVEAAHPPITEKGEKGRVLDI